MRKSQELCSRFALTEAAASSILSAVILESLASLFKVIEGGRAATRVQVKLGRGSVSNIEVQQGLQVGDQIILSDMSQWDSFERVRLN